MLALVQQQDAQLHRHQERIQELEEMVQSQTEQVSFLMQQLHQVAQESTSRQSELFRSYRDAFEDTQNDWADGVSIQLPDFTQLPAEARCAMTPDELARAQHAAASAASAAARRAPGSAPLSRSGAALPPVDGMAPSPLPPPLAPPMLPGTVGEKTFSPPGRSKHAQTLDSAQVRECLAGFDVDHIIRCLATALQNRIILATAKPRPHVAPLERTQACGIFLEPACLERLQRIHSQQQREHVSRFGSAVDLQDSLGRPVDPLNSIAVRTVPGKWDVYGFLRDVMVNFRLEPEVSVITLFYLERFSELSGIALTSDNWRRLVITAMMLSSKVWNDESFENLEFAQLCPLYSLDEINTFERIFLKCVGYNMSMKGSQYAQTYFLLRTLGAKDAADFGLEPMDATRASQLQDRCLEKQLEFRERYPEDVGISAMNWTL